MYIIRYTCILYVHKHVFILYTKTTLAIFIIVVPLVNPILFFTREKRSIKQYAVPTPIICTYEPNIVIVVVL